MAASSWRFPPAFWTANVIELCERAAYYGWFIMLAPFLTDVVGYSDIQSGYIGGLFAAFLYLLPFLSGAFADRVGYRRALLLALLLLTLGYGGIGLVPKKHWVLLSMLFIMAGGALVKPIITGTVARSSDEASRARAFSLFYMMVNIGSFFGKTVAKPVRVSFGLSMMPLLSAVVAFVALIVVAALYFPKPSAEEERKTTSLRETWHHLIADFTQVLRSGRLMALVLITAGFWIIQGQLYSSMPKYVLRLVGNDASPEWYANINPVVVTLSVVPITYLSRKLLPMVSISIALAMIPMSAAVVAILPPLLGPMALPTWLRVGPFAHGTGFLHPVTVAMVTGIAIQGLSECFLSPRYLEFASKLAPSGKEALYLGYSHLNNFFSWLIGYILSGYLIDAFCPDPAKLSAAERAAHSAALAGRGPLPAAYAHAHYLWYVFVGIGVVAFLCLIWFQVVTSRHDAQRRAAVSS
jgi:dipeptide/tripeptide permease